MQILGEDETKCVYLANPKTASTYIREVIRFTNKEYYTKTLCLNNTLYGDEEYHPHINYSDMKRFLYKYCIDLDKCYTFTTIRNPWDRMVSYFKYGVFDSQGKPYWNSEYDENTCGQYAFESFLKNFKIEKNGIVPLDKYAFDDNGNQLVNKIFKMETLGITELISFFKECKIDCDLTHKKFITLEENNVKIMPNNGKHYTQSSKLYQEYYIHQWMIDKVATLFSKDIEIGGYTF